MPPAIIIVVLALGMLSTFAFGEQRVAYLAYLLSQKQQLQTQMSKIATINHNLILNLQLNSQENFQQRWTVSAIRDQHTLAIDALAFTFTSLANKNTTCNSQDNEFGRKLTAIQSQLDKTRPIVSKQSPCLRNDYIRSNFNFYEAVYNGLKSQTINGCNGALPPTLSDVPFLNLQNTKFVPNTDSQAPWVYGPITPQQYLSKRNQLMNLYGSVSCPSQTPFLDASNNCQACLSSQVYDISLKQCRSCEADTTYNQISHQCDKSIILFNSQLAGNLNFIGTAPTPNLQVGLCPNDKPYSTGKACISCSLPMYFSFLSNTCQQCKNDSIFHPVSKACITNSFFLSNLSGVENFIGSPLSPLPYDSIKTCPSTTPFSNGRLCSSCLLPNFFNFEQMDCQSCPKDYSFDIKTHSCTSNNANAITINSNLIGNRNFVGKIPLYSSLFQNCQTNSPFFNGKQCISCSLPSYFDFDTLICTSCLNGLSFNIVIQACEYINQDYYTDVTVSNIYYNGDFYQIKKQIQEKKSSSPNIKVCFANNPFYNSSSNTCISCSDPLPLFDFKNNKCIACPNSSEFDQESHICLTKKVGATIERMIMNST